MRFLKRNWTLIFEVIKLTEFELQILELLAHQNQLLTSIYAFVAFVSVIGLGGFIVYIILRPLWFFIKKY